MKSLHLHFFIGSTDLTSAPDTISAAGRRETQHRTPGWDAEKLVHGWVTSPPAPEEAGEGPTAGPDREPTAGEPANPEHGYLTDPLALPSGATSPAVGSARLLRAFQDGGVDVQLHVYDLGAAVAPDLKNPHPEGTIPWTYLSTRHGPAELYDRYTRGRNSVGYTPWAASEVVQTFEARVAERTPDRVHAVAECVPGGTLTASLVLSAVKGSAVVAQGSSEDPRVKEARVDLFFRAWESVWREMEEFVRPGVAARGWGHRPLELFQLRYMDPLGCVLSRIVSRQCQTGEVERGPIYMLGGAQMQAPLAWAGAISPGFIPCLRQGFPVLTTPALAAWSNINHYHSARSALIEWRNSSDPGWRAYADGFAKEGCGLGGLLYLFEREFGAGERELFRVLSGG